MLWSCCRRRLVLACLGVPRLPLSCQQLPSAIDCGPFLFILWPVAVARLQVLCCAMAALYGLANGLYTCLSGTSAAAGSCHPLTTWRLGWIASDFAQLVCLQVLADACTVDEGLTTDVYTLGFMARLPCVLHVLTAVLGTSAGASSCQRDGLWPGSWGVHQVHVAGKQAVQGAAGWHGVGQLLVRCMGASTPIARGLCPQDPLLSAAGLNLCRWLARL